MSKDAVEEALKQQVADLDYYTAVGKALSSWSQVEHTIGLVFSLVLGAPGQEAPLKAYWSLHSFEQRLQMTTVAVKATLRDSEELLRRWKGLAKELRAANDVRNEIAHGTVIRYGGEIYFCRYLYADIMKSLEERMTLKEIGERTAGFPEVGSRAHGFYEDANRHLEARGARGSARDAAGG